MKEEEGAFPEACSLGAEMQVALGWRRLVEHFAKSMVWLGGEDLNPQGQSGGGGLGGRMEDSH